MTNPYPRYQPVPPRPPVSAVPTTYLPAVPVGPAQIIVPSVPTSGMATASLVLGILGVLGGWCLFGLPCLLAVVFGHLGLHQTRTGTKSGRGMAVAGLVLGYVFVGPMIAFTFLMFFGTLLGAATPTPTATP